jgi:hypothetical protein
VAQEALRKRVTPAVGGRLVASAIWLALLFTLIAIDSDSNDSAVTAISVGSTLALGLVVGRWWVLAVPLIPLAALTVANVAGGPSGEDSVAGWEAVLIMLFFGAEFLLFLPVAFRTIVRRLD